MANATPVGLKRGKQPTVQWLRLGGGMDGKQGTLLHVLAQVESPQASE